MYHRAENQHFLLARSCTEVNISMFLTSFPFFSRIIYLTLIVCFKSFYFFFFLRKGKACHSLTGYVIIVKFMLFCNLETSYSMAHLIKHLKQTCMIPWFLWGVMSSGWWRLQRDLCVRGPDCSIVALASPSWLWAVDCPGCPCGPDISWVLPAAAPGAFVAVNLNGYLRGMQTRVIFLLYRGGGWDTQGKRCI